MKLSKWHQELDQFIDIKSTFVMEGNVYDMQTYPTKLENNEIRWDLMLLDNYIYHNDIASSVIELGKYNLCQDKVIPGMPKLFNMVE